MASDLSLQIQEAITSTIEQSLTNDSGISILKTYKATTQSLKGLNVLVINASFVFEKLTTNLKFVLPARTATVIAHAMLMEDTPPLDTISDDIADAMKESVTQICGTLQTVINSAAFEDLGKTSFSIGDFEIIDGSDYQVVNTFILFKLSLGENIFEYFIDFDESLLPFIEELGNSDLLAIEESDEVVERATNEVEEIKKSNEEEDYTPPKDNSQTEESIEEGNAQPEETPQIKEDENIVDGSETSDENLEDEALQKKNKKIKIIVIVLAAIVAIVIIGFSLLLFMGYFDKEEVIVDTNVTKEQNLTTPSEESLVMAEIQNKQIDFKLNMINEERLNNKLQYLTKYEILEEDVLAKFKKDEAERLYKLKMEKLEEFALNNKEESLYNPSLDGNNTSNQSLVKSRFDDENTIDKQVMNSEQNLEALNNESLMFIKIDPKEYKKYKDVVNNNKQDETQVSICKDSNGVVNVYVGPLYLKTIINNILNGAKKVDTNSKKDMEIVTTTRGEFNKMCDF
ncbi:MAG: hypothetical protein RBT59_05010 [Arcobacteraceae bacterium]|jgi:hypothetical protein|nr:hypothetical protein [Arcobacteraceae bacterium]